MWLLVLIRLVQRDCLEPSLNHFFWKCQRWLSWLVSALQGAQMWWAEGLELRSKMTVKKTMIPPTAAAEHAGPGLTFKLFARLAT